MARWQRPGPLRLPATLRPPATLSLLAILSLLATLSACGGPAAPVVAPSRTPAITTSIPFTPAPPSTFDPGAFTPPKITTTTLINHFRYDASAPLDVTVTSRREQDGATIEQISYLVRGTGRIPAQLVFPTARHGRLPGVVLAHGGAIDPDAFLADALALVKHGVVAILPDIPMTITGDTATDVAYVTNSVIAQRRAIDLLVARSDVDSHRLGFVGHSWGADLAAIMAGVEPRLRAVVIACARSRMSGDMYTMGSPAGAMAYMTAASLLDGFRYVAIPGVRKILLQYGRLDDSIPDIERTELTRSTAGSKTRKDYDAGHDLINEPVAATDRLAFLVNTLG